MYPQSQQPTDNTLQRLPQQPSVIMQAPPSLMLSSYGPNNDSVTQRSVTSEGSFLSMSEQVGSAFRNTKPDQPPVTASENS